MRPLPSHSLPASYRGPPVSSSLLFKLSRFPVCGFLISRGLPILLWPGESVASPGLGLPAPPTLCPACPTCLGGLPLTFPQLSPSLPTVTDHCSLASPCACARSRAGSGRWRLRETPSPCPANSAHPHCAFPACLPPPHPLTSLIPGLPEPSPLMSSSPAPPGSGNPPALHSADPSLQCQPPHCTPFLPPPPPPAGWLRVRAPHFSPLRQVLPGGPAALLHGRLWDGRRHLSQGEGPGQWPAGLAAGSGGGGLLADLFAIPVALSQFQTETQSRAAVPKPQVLPGWQAPGSSQSLTKTPVLGTQKEGGTVENLPLSSGGDGGQELVTCRNTPPSPPRSPSLTL